MEGMMNVIFKKSTLTPSEMAIQESILARLATLEEQVSTLIGKQDSEEIESETDDTTD